MLFTRPQPWETLIAWLESRRLLPTTLGTEELSRLRAQVRQRAIFSARTTMGEHLQVVRDATRTMASGESNLAAGKLQLKRSLDRLGYRPAEEERGTLRDLSSESRRELVVRTQTEMVQGAARHLADQAPARLDAWPAKELVRDRASKVPRKWRLIWQEKGGPLYGDGRMIALVNDPIWRAISRFGLPYPPFDFGSGMGTEDISRAEAVRLGVMTADQVVTPDPEAQDINSGLQARPQITDADLRAAVLEDLGPGFVWDGEILRRAA